MDEIFYILEVKEEINACVDRKSIADVVNDYKLYDSTTPLIDLAKKDYLSSVDVVDKIIANDKYQQILNYYQIASKQLKQGKFNKQDYLEWLNNDNNLFILDNLELNDDNFIQKLDYIIERYEDNQRPEEFIDFYNTLDDKEIINTNINNIPSSYIITSNDYIERG